MGSNTYCVFTGRGRHTPGKEGRIRGVIFRVRGLPLSLWAHGTPSLDSDPPTGRESSTEEGPQALKSVWFSPEEEMGQEAM